MAGSSQALALSRRGFKIFRLKSGTKGGRGNFVDSDWTNQATADNIEVFERWGNGDFNIGILCNGLVVLDVDTKGGKKGDESLAALGELPETFTCETASGGRHIFFSSGGQDFANGVDLLGDGLDIRGHNGYVVGPGSTIGGKAYRVITDAPVAPLPEHLAARIKLARKRDQTIAATSAELDTEPNKHAAREYLKTVEPAVAGQGGDGHIYKTTCAVFEYGLSLDGAREAMEDWRARCSPYPEQDYWDRVTDHAWEYRTSSKTPNSTEGFTPFAGFPMPATQPGGNFITKITEYNEFDLADAMAFKARPWIVRGLLMRGSLSQLVAPGATGKTAFEMQLAIAVSTKEMQTIALKTPDNKSTYELREQVRALVVNFEDPHDELKRRLATVLKGFDLDFNKHKRCVGLASAADHPFKIAARNNTTKRVEISKEGRDLIEHIMDEKLGAVFLDPLVDLHEASENDNTEMSAVASVLRLIARQTDAAVMIAHHTRKPPAASTDSYAGSMDAGRGASAISGAIRVGVTMFGMSEKDAEAMDVKQEDRHRYVRVDDAKQNLILASPNARWFQKEPVKIGIENEELGLFRPVDLTGKTAMQLATVAQAIGKHLLPGHDMALDKLATLLMREGFFTDRSGSTVARMIQTAFLRGPLVVGSARLDFEKSGKTGGRISCRKHSSN